MYVYALYLSFGLVIRYTLLFTSNDDGWAALCHDCDCGCAAPVMVVIDVVGHGCCRCCWQLRPGWCCYHLGQPPYSHLSHVIPVRALSLAPVHVLSHGIGVRAVSYVRRALFHVVATSARGFCPLFTDPPRTKTDNLTLPITRSLSLINLLFSYFRFCFCSCSRSRKLMTLARSSTELTAGSLSN